MSYFVKFIPTKAGYYSVIPWFRACATIAVYHDPYHWYDEVSA